MMMIWYCKCAQIHASKKNAQIEAQQQEEKENDEWMHEANVMQQTTAKIAHN